MAYPDPGHSVAASDSLGAVQLFHLQILGQHFFRQHQQQRFQLRVTVAAEVVGFEHFGFGLLVIVGSINYWSVNVDGYGRTLIPLEPHVPAESPDANRPSMPSSGYSRCMHGSWENVRGQRLAKNHQTDDVPRSTDDCGES